MAESDSFNFEAHKQKAVSQYLEKQLFYTSLSDVVRRIVEEALRSTSIVPHSVQARAKEPSSFGRKAAQPSEENTNAPKYPNPLEQITDLAGVRVITYFPRDVKAIDPVISNEFEIVERSDKSEELIEDDKFGYLSIHYLVRLSKSRAALPEYAPYSKHIAEVQVRTILQHAWAEIEHDIQYKSAIVIPGEIRRRFMALAGLLEIADREFQAIQDADRELTNEARTQVAARQLNQVEITPDALKAFLDQELGPDGRISRFSYEYTARLLKRLGFRTLDQVMECISGFDHDKLSRLATSGYREGQVTRFEYAILAGMGERFLDRHSLGALDWFRIDRLELIRKFKNGGIAVRSYDPLEPAENVE